MAMMSSTKSIAAIVAFMLRDDSGGEFALDTPVHRILTDWEDWQSPPKSLVTVRHLLTQTAGIPGNRYCSTAQCPQWGSVGDNHNERARTLDLPEELLPPGTKFDYSNAGTQLLDPVLSRIAKRDLASFCEERIFSPLGMKETNLRRFDDQSGGTFVYADMESTPRDMAKLALALLEGRLLSQESRDEMFSTPRERISGANPGYGHLFWKDLECRVISMQGYLGNDVYMIPAHDLILVRTQAAPPEDNSFYSRSSEAFLRFVGGGG
jgi:CubicO group peptidase (beta-lactamase class C family)